MNLGKHTGKLTYGKLAILIVAGLCGLALGWVLDLTGVCPVVKRIWTPSWALFSSGWCCLILAALYAVIDVLQWRRNAITRCLTRL